MTTALVQLGARAPVEGPEGLLRETGAEDAEGAFLALLRRHHPRHALAEPGEDQDGEAAR